MFCGDETWVFNEEDLCRSKYTKMRMVRWMSGVLLNDRSGGNKIVNEELRRIGFDCNNDVLRRGRLRWYVYVEKL